MQLVCVVCAAQFEPAGRNGKNAKYCGRKCWPSSSKPHRPVGDERHCDRCGEVFSRSARGGGRVRYCSDACLNPKPAKVSRACEECGEQISRGSNCAKHKKRPCAECGRVIVGNTGKRYCSDICRWSSRKTGQSTPLTWVQCLCSKWTCRPGRKYCCKNCANEALAIRSGYRNRPCKDCGISLGYLSLVTYCDSCRRQRTAIRERAARRNRRPRRKDKERAEDYGVAYEPISRLKVYERDGWKCGICRRKVDKRLKYPHPMSASLDHINPLSLRIWEYGHTYENVQCAHWECNVRKGNQGAGDQLALIG